jgi:putative flippase GtrA
MRARVRRLVDDHGVKMSKYLVGSVAASVISALTYLATFGPSLLGSKGASLAASATGALTNYFINRRWTWSRRGRADFRREVLPYWTTVLTTAAAAAIVTGTVNAILRHEDVARSTRALVNTIAFVGVYGVAFLFKYRRFDQIFAKLHLHHERVAAHPAPAPTEPEQPEVQASGEPTDRGQDSPTDAPRTITVEGQPASRVSSASRD